MLAISKGTMIHPSIFHSSLLSVRCCASHFAEEKSSSCSHVRPQEVWPGPPALSHDHKGWGWGLCCSLTPSSLPGAASLPGPVHGWLTLEEEEHTLTTLIRTFGM